jgi:hypothetical protein
MFSRPNDAHWFGPHGAVFVPECHGKELVDILSDVLRRDPQPVSREEREVRPSQVQLVGPRRGVLETRHGKDERVKKILWVGDAACDSGFAKATHKTLEAFVRMGGTSSCSD